VAALAWRPNAGMSLAVGGAGGVCVWALGKGGAASGGGSAAGGHTAGMTWLQAPSGGTVTALAWHPRGRMLAGAGPGVAGMVVWDVATGTLVPLRVRVVLGF
jgi:aladin